MLPCVSTGAIRPTLAIARAEGRERGPIHAAQSDGNIALRLRSLERRHLSTLPGHSLPPSGREEGGLQRPAFRHCVRNFYAAVDFIRCVMTFNFFHSPKEVK